MGTGLPCELRTILRQLPGSGLLRQDLTTQIFSSFVQDEIAILPDRLYITLGTKAEHEYYNGFNLQPTARVTWTPDDRDMFWAAISGAQGTPSRVDTSIRFNYAASPGPGNLPVLISLFGNPDQKNERLIATEAGFRKQVSDRLSFDSTIFFNHYHDLISEEPGSPVLETNPPPVHLLIPTTSPICYTERPTAWRCSPI